MTNEDLEKEIIDTMLDKKTVTVELLKYPIGNKILGIAIRHLFEENNPYLFETIRYYNDEEKGIIRHSSENTLDDQKIAGINFTENYWKFLQYKYEKDHPKKELPDKLVYDKEKLYQAFLKRSEEIKDGKDMECR